MKIALIALAMTLACAGQASQSPAKTFNFQFKSIKSPIQAKGSSKEEAFRVAARECFQKLTGGKYPGEEKGLDIIDICANPKM